MTVSVLTTIDGRTLAYEELGDPAGVPVFTLHGTPGCRLSGRHPDPLRVSEAGLRLISYDRPGYGRSSRHRGRRVVDCATDIAAIADALEIARFAVSGGSGGGPHALAAGARLPERVTRVECDVGVAPYGASGLDWFAGMDPINVREFSSALGGEATLTRVLEHEARRALDQVEDDPIALLNGIELSAADRAVLEDPGVREIVLAATREMFTQGVWGWVDDDLAIVGPWGFDIAELRVPVAVRYGGADVLVPAGHGAWLAAHIPNAHVTVDENGGHLLTPNELLDSLRAVAAV